MLKKLSDRCIKKIAVLLAAVLCCAFLAGCGEATDENIIGLWESTYSENGKEIKSSIALNAYGEYGKVVMINGEFSAADIGTYKREENIIILYKNGEDSNVEEYEYYMGKLTNNGHKFIKTE